MRWVFGVFTGLVLICLLPLSAARFYDGESKTGLMVAAFSSYAVLGYAVVLLLVLVQLRTARGRVFPLLGVVVSLALLLTHVVWLAPYFRGGSDARADLVVLTSNLEFGRGDPEQVVRRIESSKAGLVVLEEVTPTALAGLNDAGLSRMLPHHAGSSISGTRGTLVFSRYPLTDQQPLTLANQGLVVTVGTPRPVRLLAVHTAQPVQSPERWHLDLSHVADRIALEAKSLPVLAVGDFNSTPDHVPFRHIVAQGVADAAEQAGSGWQPTWPTKWRKSWLRPLVTLDHVLCGRGITALRTSTFAVDHTDHLGLVVDLRLPADVG